MSDDRSIDELKQKAQELGLWKDDMSEKDLLWLIINKQKEENDKQKEEIHRQKEEIHRQKEEIHERSLGALKDYIRPLVNRTDSLPHVEKLKHEKAKIIRVTYEYDDAIGLALDERYSRPDDSSVHSETDVQSIIFEILKAVSRKASKDIHLAQNRRIAGVECDIVLLYGSNWIPFAAVEIKKNGPKEFVQAIFEDDDSVRDGLKGKVQGEHCTQLETIQFFGFEKVFGLISDGNHSMITCTGHFSKEEDFPRSAETPGKKRGAYTMNEDQMSPSTEITFVPKTRAARVMSKTRKTAVTSSNPMARAAAGAVSQLSGRNKGRSLYCSYYSDVVRDSGTGAKANWLPTLKLLTHFVTLAINSVDPNQFNRDIRLNKNLPARVIRRDGSRKFAHTTIEFKGKRQPDLYKCLLLNTGVTEIYLFKSLGMGNNGDCCLGTTTSGKSFCAVKFFAIRNEALGCAEKEKGSWHNIYGELPRAEVVELPRTDDYENNDRPDACLLMPYLVPIEVKKRDQALRDGSVRACLVRFAASNYHHNEVRWRHLGKFCTDSKTQVYLCDLGNLTMRGDNETDAEWNVKTDAWISDCIDNLERKATE